jgi:uncharacterized protein YqgQ
VSSTYTQKVDIIKKRAGIYPALFFAQYTMLSLDPASLQVSWYPVSKDEIERMSYEDQLIYEADVVAKEQYTVRTAVEVVEKRAKESNIE